MVELISLLSKSFFVASAVSVAALALVLSLALLQYLRRRWRRTRRSRASKQTQQDFLNTRILFQTMRDFLEQQRDLARDLNKSLNHKVAYIKETVDAAMADLKVLRESVQDLSQRLDDARRELAELRNHPGSWDTPLAEPSIAQERNRSALHVLAHPATPEPKDDLLDHWAGLDFSGVTDEPIAPEQPPEAPEDGDAARRAFRALLSIETERPKGSAPAEELLRGSREPGGNGRINALHARVYEYSDAGMGVPNIARELGIGKGEIRLILSLRKARG